MSSELEWKHRDLGELVDVLDSRRIPLSAKERAARLGDVPYYGATGQVGWIDDALFDEPLLLLGEDGVQFFDRDKPKAYVIAGRAWVNNHAHVLRARTGLINQRFLLHYLNWFDYADFANGTTRLKLTKSAMLRIPVVLPPLDEQQCIVGILEGHLSRLDAADNLLQRNANRLAMLRLVLLADARSRLIADGTDVRTIGSICDTTLGKMLDAKKSTGEPTPYLRNINVRWGHVDLAELFTVPLTPAERQHLALRQGDLLVCEGGEPGRCAVWESDSPLIAYQKALHRIRVRDDRVDPYFLAAMLEEAVRTGRAARLFTGTTIRHLPQEKLRAIEIPVPALKIQRELLGRLNDQDAAVRRFGRQIEQEKCRVANLRRSLLRAAFTGYLSAKSMDIEVAGEMACV